MADALETARQIVKTHDDCQVEGADMATLVSRIEAHVLAYAAYRERLFAEADEAIAQLNERFRSRLRFRGAVEESFIPAALARHRARSSSPAKVCNLCFGRGYVLTDGEPGWEECAQSHPCPNGCKASSPAQDEGKPTT